MCTAGSQWLSDSRSSTSGLYRTNPAAPPWRTLYPFSTRALMPRLHRTRSPVTEPGGSGFLHNGSSYPGTFPAFTTGAGESRPAVTLTPCTSSEPPPGEAKWMVVTNCRGEVAAPTVSVHGPTWFAVPGVGPELAAAALTEMPAA